MKLPLIPTVFTASALIVLLILGTWQVQRLMWKNNLHAEITAKAEMPPISLPRENINIETLKYLRVIVKGHFLHDKEVHLFTGARQMSGGSGYNIFTPMESKNGSVVLVDRGWVSAKQKERATRPETLLQGEISILGMLHKGEHKGRFTHDNNITKNIWFWIDIPTIASFTGKQLENVYVRALDGDGYNGNLPILGKATIEIRNDHLQYAIIWYSFAITLLVIYGIYIKKSGGGFG